MRVFLIGYSNADGSDVEDWYETAPCFDSLEKAVKWLHEKRMDMVSDGNLGADECLVNETEKCFRMGSHLWAIYEKEVN